MALSLKNLFGRKDNSIVNDPTIAGTTLNGDIVVSSKINWRTEGITDAGTAKGAVDAFRAGVGSCFARVKKSQELDQQLQEKMKLQLSNEKVSLEGDLSSEKGKLEAARTKHETSKSAVVNKQREISNAQSGITNKEKSVRLNFMIGVGITALLTIYLFIFYSSTAYSAFFRNFDVSDNVQEAMFDGNAVVDAFKASFFEGCFILFMPVIFLGLGFVAHGFSTTSKGFGRYAKTFVLYLITFAFDSLLAYKISKEFYDIEAAVTLVEMPPFSTKIAFADMDFWIVIFCGFVSYVIWGLVFDFTMNCYDRLTNNKYELQTLYKELDDLQMNLSQQQSNLLQIEQKVNDIQAKIKQKEHELNTHVRYDYEVIRQSLADYYLGWTSYFGLASKDTSLLKGIFDQEMKSVEIWINNKL